MVLLSLEIKAELESLTNLQPQDASDFPYFFKVKCGSCGEISDKFSCVSASEMVDLPKSRGKAHLVQKCKFCGRDGSITMVEGKGSPYTLEDSESGKYISIACFDCRGIEPCEFSFRSGWAAEGGQSLNSDTKSFKSVPHNKILAGIACDHEGPICDCDQIP